MAEGRPPIPSEERRAAEQRSSEALQRLSHDIRSAMSDVLGGIRLVDTARLDPQTQTQIDRVRAASDTLAALVDDALMVASGETQIRAQHFDVDVDLWLRALEGRWAGRAAERGSRFVLDRQGALPKRLLVSPIELARVVGNLVGNALIHAGGGDVAIEVSCERSRGFWICIKDQGSGFPEHVLQADDGLVPSDRGSGLGLSIARELSAGMPANLWLRNEPDTGHGCACLLIPKEKVVWTVEAKPDAVIPDLSDLRILMAEDNLTNQTILRQMLEGMGAQTVIVADGQAAMGALGRERFDIALLDIEMPRMSGLEVMEQVRAASGELATMPLVAVTAYVLRDNREAIYAAGADGIIGKPIASPAEFGRAILRYVGRATGETIPTDVLSGGGLEPKMDIGRLDRLLEAAGAEGSVELLARMTEDLQAVGHALGIGVAAADAEEVRAQTHILIAISGAAGAERLCQFAEVLNIAAKRSNLDQMPLIHGHLQADLDDLITVIRARHASLS
ncbi:response regulator [Gymnodinialimonas ceratoperidinii]|uniref:Response regulator n=1 Tax=Gymnodinialimonas ceratoperidinii TaxID=2856823 RepID=A0A8F6TZJ6_9RHOB|nr:response regulator [Gymnodinialimonas ceratoperidinii]QXT41044.1 response regulator [Gymnodinialimonas ceratoperidinii]